MNNQQQEVGALLSVAVPTCQEDDVFQTVVNTLTEKAWDDIDSVFVLGSNGELKGVVRVAQAVQSDPLATAASMMQEVKVTLHPTDDREKVIFSTVKHDLEILPVVDKDNLFLGAVTAKTIINIMHTEHLEDALFSSGLQGQGADIIRLATSGIPEVITSRAPWLVMGILAGLGLGLIASRFEDALKESIALAYFIPVVAYIADSVGTQAEAIAVRNLAVLKLNYVSYLIRELVVGFLLGLMVGVIGGIGAIFIAGSTAIGLVVGISLVLASTIASMLASLIPMMFKSFGKDPALGSGPLATALQDILSVVIYFLVAEIILLP